MLKKILVLGSQRKKSQEIIEFFKKYPQAYKISALLCNDETQLDLFKKQIKELSPSVIFFPNQGIAEKLEMEFNISCYFDYSQYNMFLKKSDCDLVISDITGIDSVKLMLATIGSYKDIGLLNLEPILYSGKIIINEARARCVAVNYITAPFQMMSRYLKTMKVSDINKVILIDYDTKEDKEALSGYIHPSRKLSEFKKVFYFKNKMWLSRHLIAFNNIYDIDLEKFEVYKSNTNNVGVILQLKDGSNLFNYTDGTKESIYKQYFLDNRQIRENPSLGNTIDIKLEKTQIEKIASLELAYKAIKLGGSYPILFQIVYDICAEGIYSKNLPKDSFIKMFSKILDDKTFYSKMPNLQTIFALEGKVRQELKK